MWAESKTVNYREVELRFPAVEHLIALKLHALRQNLSQRAIKGFPGRG
jgi:hypothetical protein